jgi:crotonobetainyl-CoA:carnitine CoA-transferase CaiB-like acyl-CoA transferase
VTRLLPPWPDNQPGINRSGYFNQYNQGKRSFTLNLKQPEAIEIAKQLVAKSDIVTENFAGGVMDRLGLGYDTLKQIKPDIIMISLSGYGATGPEREYISYGPAQVPMSGMSSLTGYKGWRPMHVGISYGDPNGGLHGAFAVMCALMYRARTGKGQYIDMSQWETSTAMVAEGLLDYSMNGTQPDRDGNRDPHMAPHGVFRSAGQDRWVSLAVRNDDEWQRLCTVIGRSELATDPRFATLAARKQNEDTLEAILTEWTCPRSPEEATELLQAAGIPAAPSMSNKDLSTDPHLNSRSIFVYLEHPEVGVKQHVGIPWQLSKTPLSVRKPAPLLGQDTDYVLREILGYSTEDVAALRERQVLT